MIEDRTNREIVLGDDKPEPDGPKTGNPREAAEGGQQAPAPKQPEPSKPRGDNKP